MSLYLSILIQLLHLTTTLASFKPILNLQRPITVAPVATITVHADITDVREVSELNFHATTSIEELNLFLRQSAIDNTPEIEQLILKQTSPGQRPNSVAVCLKTIGWCRDSTSQLGSCNQQYRDSKPQCWTLNTFDQSHGFAIHIQGKIIVQITIQDAMGFIYATTPIKWYYATKDSETKQLTEEEYFHKFQSETQNKPFGDSYYGIFAELIRQIFVRKEVPSGELKPYLQHRLSPSKDKDVSILPLNVVEIGIARAGHASNILSELNASILGKMYGIDPYLAHYDTTDIFAIKKQFEFDAMSVWIQDRLSKEEFIRNNSTSTSTSSSRFELLRMISSEAVQELSNISIHAVFVDGDHRAEAVLDDLLNWYPKLISGGLIAGDDFHLPGVAEGVRLFFNTFDELPIQERPVLQIVSRVQGYQLFAFTKP